MTAPTYHTYTDPTPNPNGGGVGLTNSSSLWIFNKSISATTSSAIFGDKEWNLNTVEVNAAITATIHFGIYLMGAQNTVKIGQGGAVGSNDTAVYMGGDHSELINNGTIGGKSVSVQIEGGSYAGFVNNNTINNRCFIKGDTVTVQLGTGSKIKGYLQIDAATATILNEGSWEALPGGAALSGSDGNDMLTNKETGMIIGNIQLYDGNNAFINQGGTLTGSVSAYDGADKIVNSGTIDGSASLFGGNDLFDNRGGKFTGWVYGGAGDDTFILDAADVKIGESAGEGTDTLKSTVSQSLNAFPPISGKPQELENLTLLGSAAIDGTGNALNNVITGNTAANKLQGLDGNDAVTGDAGNDSLYGGSGSDTLDGGSGHDILDGSVGLDRLAGGVGNDKLYGGTDADTLSGGTGNDVLSGGSGKDIFVFDTKVSAKTNLDRISDFNIRDDSIWLDNKYMAKLGKGTLSKPLKLNKAFFTIGDKAKDSNDYLVYNAKTGILSYDIDGSGAKAAVAIATLKKGLKLTYADFFVI